MNNSNVTILKPGRETAHIPIDPDINPNASPNNGGGDGGGNDMLERVKKLEETIGSLATDVAILKDKVATKGDVQSCITDFHKELNTQTWRIVLALIFTVVLAVLSRYFLK